jgi:hypothetical protein
VAATVVEESLVTVQESEVVFTIPSLTRRSKVTVQVPPPKTSIVAWKAVIVPAVAIVSPADGSTVVGEPTPSSGR